MMSRPWRRAFASRIKALASLIAALALLVTAFVLRVTSLTFVVVFSRIKAFASACLRNRAVAFASSCIKAFALCIKAVMENIQGNVQGAVRVATSKPVQRAAVNTALLVSGAATLFCLAAVVTGVFFYNFLPHQLVELPVHLQYGLSPNPHAVLSLTRPPILKTRQEYDVSVLLSMPRSPPNVERGNFMISLNLLQNDASAKHEADARVFAHVHDRFGTNKVLFASRRPALVPYEDPVISLSKRLLLLLYYILFPNSQTCNMKVDLAERLAFSKESDLPASAYVEIEAGQNIHIYRAALVMTARMRGLRWLIARFRTATYIASTLVFWACEVLFMSLAWVSLAVVKGSRGPRETNKRQPGTGGDAKDKEDKGESSEHAYTFPTVGKQPALKYEPNIKVEDDGQPGQSLAALPVAGAEGDDEDERKPDEDRRKNDSGLGSSYSEKGSDSVRRRASRNASE